MEACTLIDMQQDSFRPSILGKTKNQTIEACCLNIVNSFLFVCIFSCAVGFKRRERFCSPETRNLQSSNSYMEMTGSTQPITGRELGRNA